MSGGAKGLGEKSMKNGETGNGDGGKDEEHALKF